MKLFTSALLLFLTFTLANAQSTAPIVAEPIVTEQPASPGQTPTAATAETQVGGLLAYLISNGTVTISGPRIAGGTSTVTISLSPSTGPGSPRTITATIPLASDSDNESDQVTLTFRLRRLGNGLDYTYSRVGRINREIRR